MGGGSTRIIHIKDPPSFFCHLSVYVFPIEGGFSRVFLVPRNAIFPFPSVSPPSLLSFPLLLSSPIFEHLSELSHSMFCALNFWHKCTRYENERKKEVQLRI